MWRKILTALAILMLVVGLGFVLFPPVSNFVGTQISNSTADKFDEIADNLEDGSFEEAVEKGEVDKECYPIDEKGNRTSDKPKVFSFDIDKLKADSIDYNKMLLNEQSTMLTGYNSYAQPSLDLRSYGIYDNIYGYITADSINLRLPVYLGASDYNMAYGAGHMSATSLPTGEPDETANCVIAAHTGYIGRIFFDNLRALQYGDEISFKNYWTTVKYKVVETRIVTPAEATDIYLQKGRNLMTLVTCVSDGKGGYDRFLAICEAQLPKSVDSTQPSTTE